MKISRQASKYVLPPHSPGRRMLILLFCVSAVAFAAGPSQEAIEAGRIRFIDACSACHGPNGLGGHGPALVSPRIRRASDKQLFAAIANGVPGTEMPAFKLPAETITSMVAFLRSLTATASESHVKGDAQLGKTMFFGKGGCSGCHMIRGQGGYLGPDLTEIGMARSLAELRESIVAPNARPTPGFESVTFGNGAKGVAKYRTNYSVQIIDAGGKLHLLRGADAAKVVVQPQSWMPASNLSADELQSLLAFLSRP